MPCEAKGCQESRRPSFTSRRHAKPRVSRYCEKHSRRYKQYGAPKQERILRRQVQPFQDAADRFLKLHREDEQVLSALSITQSLLTPEDSEPPSRLSRAWYAPGTMRNRGGINPAYHVFKNLRRLQRATTVDRSRSKEMGGRRVRGEFLPRKALPPVTALEALSRLLGLWYFYEACPEYFTKDDVPLSVALARTVFLLRPRPKSRTNTQRLALTGMKMWGDKVRDVLGIFFIRAVETIRQEERIRAENTQAIAKPIKSKVAEIPKPPAPQPPPSPLPTPPPSPPPAPAQRSEQARPGSFAEWRQKQHSEASKLAQRERT